MSKKNIIAVAALCALAVSHLGCTYALLGPVPSSTRKVKLVSNVPSTYDIQMDLREPWEYHTDSEGKVDITLPAYRPPCKVYLFNIVKVGGGREYPGHWRVKIISQGKTLHRLSIRDIDRLPVDSEGYHVLRLKK